jgi:FdhD protein
VKGNIISVPIRKVEPGSKLVSPGLTFEGLAAQDLVAVEEPLQIRLGDRDFAITMRTPGQDLELAAGFLFTEGVINSADQIAGIIVDDRGAVTVRLIETIEVEFAARNFYVTSSCGVCGKASIDGLKAAACTSPPRGVPQIQASLISQLPDKLRQAQPIFGHTGGLHGAGLFDTSGQLLAVREDVGRHNAVDKLVGSTFLEGKTPLHDNVLLLSGRISFELVQKALMAGIPIIAAVGAPSSLAIETALHFGMTLIGFVRGQRYNVYSGAERLL